MVVRRIWDAEVVGSNPATLISNRLHNRRLMVVEDSVVVESVAILLAVLLVLLVVQVEVQEKVIAHVLQVILLQQILLKEILEERKKAVVVEPQQLDQLDVVIILHLVELEVLEHQIQV